MCYYVKDRLLTIEKIIKNNLSLMIYGRTAYSESFQFQRGGISKCNFFKCLFTSWKDAYLIKMNKVQCIYNLSFTHTYSCFLSS